MGKLLVNFMIVCSVPLLLVFAVGRTLAMPDVYFSYSTGDCVKVVNYTDEQFSCENYPTKFNHVWAE